MPLKISLILAVCAFLVNVPVAASWRCNDCDVIYKAKGCYNDNPSRVLKTQVINERDPSSNVFDGHRIEWKNWNNYMVEFACRCAKAVKEKGWKIFGLQHYGECWSGAPNTYDESNFVSSDSCIGEDYKPCGGLDRHCVGPKLTNFVFEIVDCDVQFERVGCFRDNEIAPRPLTELMMTDRVKNLPVSSGQKIVWRNWDSYMPEFVCRCAKKAKEKGYTTFGVQYYGECWSGPNGDETYGKLGPSTNCVDECVEPCHSYKPFCAGKQFANAVYILSVPDKRSLDEEAKVVGRNDDEEPLFDVQAKTAANPQKLNRVKEKKSTGRKFKRFP